MNLRTYLAKNIRGTDEQRRAWWVEHAQQRARQTKRRVYVYMPAGSHWWLQYEPEERQAADIIITKDGRIESCK